MESPNVGHVMSMNRAHLQPDVAGAIRRSSKARAALRSRRRKVAALTAMLAIALAGAGTWSIGEITGNDVVEAAVAKVGSVADMLGQRSPGERTKAQLTKTKHARLLSKQAKPAISPKASMTDLARLLDVAPPAPLPVNVGVPPLQIAMATPSLGDIIVQPPAAGSPGTPPGAPPVVLPPGGSTPISVPTPQPRSLVLVPSAVPEPSTWATMLLGFALIGWTVRRARSLSPRMS